MDPHLKQIYFSPHLLSPSADTKWLITFFTIDLLNNIGGAALATIFGPSQPYIAERVGVNIDTITWVWTFCERKKYLFAVWEIEECVEYY